MAKATSQLAPTPITGNLNIDQGAAAVLALINRSPRTPSLEEIRAVLQQIGSPCQSSADSNLLAQIGDLLPRVQAAEGDCVDELTGQLLDLAYRLLETPAAPDDLNVRARLCMYWNDNWERHDRRDQTMDAASLEDLVRSVLWLGQVRPTVMCLGRIPHRFTKISWEYNSLLRTLTPLI